MAERDAPPFWTLAVGALLAVVTVAATSLTRYTAERLDPYYFQTGRLSAAHQPTVAVIGTSLVRHALPFDDEIKTWPGAATFQLVRFTQASGTASDFTALLPKLLGSPVKTVVFQAEPLILRFGDCHPRRTRAFRVVGDALDRYRHTVTALRYLLAGNGENFGDGGLVLDAPKGEPDIDLLIKPCVAGTALPDGYGEFLDTARARGIRVVLLSLGRSPRADAALGKNFQANYEQAVAMLAARHGMEVWRFPRQPDRHYRDRAHLNTQGRQAFTRWFLNKLAERS